MGVRRFRVAVRFRVDQYVLLRGERRRGLRGRRQPRRRRQEHAFAAEDSDRG